MSTHRPASEIVNEIVGQRLITRPRLRAAVESDDLLRAELVSLAAAVMEDSGVAALKTAVAMIEHLMVMVPNQGSES